MSRMPSDWLATPNFHPEFGLFCPSPGMRRGMRVVALSVVTTIVIAATMGLVIAHRTDSESPASVAQPRDEAPLAIAPAAGNDAARVGESCRADVPTDLAASFLNAACGSNKLHARHGARAANRVATVIIGRIDAPPAPMEAAAPQVKADNTETSALTKKPKHKASAPIALVPPASDPSRQNAMLGSPAFSAYGYAPRLGREAYDPYHGSTAPPSGYGSFGWVR